MKEKKRYNEDPIEQTITGEVVTLRPYNEKTDKRIFYKMFMNDKSFDAFFPYPINKKEFKERWLEGRCTLFNNGWWGNFGFVVERNADKATMGCITCDGTIHHILKIGYYMGKQYRRRGYMVSALELLIRCGFKGQLYQFDHDVNKNRKYMINAFKVSVDAHNHDSDAVLRRLGFVYSGFEFCAVSNNKGVCKDQIHYYLENLQHPPIRKCAYNGKE